VYRECDEPEREQDAICPHGHSAVTCINEPPADCTRIVLLPAARVIDGEQIVASERFFVIISDAHGASESMSGNCYPWKEAIAIAQCFSNKQFSESTVLWNKINP
jgi:hypothetical protein